MLAVLELQRIHVNQRLRQFDAVARVKEGMQALAGAQAHVVAALGADGKIALDLRAIEDGVAVRTLAPQPFGHGALAGGLGADLGRD